MASKRILEDEETLLQLANEAYPSIVKRRRSKDLGSKTRGLSLSTWLSILKRPWGQYAQHHTALIDRIQEL